MEVLSRNVLMEEEGIGEVVLFHTRCMVKERCVNLTIDEGSTVNMVSIEVVEKLGLNMAPLERPYTLKWFKGEIKITHRILVIFDLGKYCCAELFTFVQCPWCLVTCYSGTHGARASGLFETSGKILTLYHGRVNEYVLLQCQRMYLLQIGEVV